MSPFTSPGDHVSSTRHKPTPGSQVSTTKILLIAGLATQLLLATIHPTDAGAQCPTSRQSVIVNRKPVQADESRVLLELLQRHVSPARLGLLASSDSQPAVIIDGLLASGDLRVLADIPALAVDSVSVLRPVDAVRRLGLRGANGAIVITTRSGQGSRSGPCGGTELMNLPFGENGERRTRPPG